jgi:fructokinase
MSDSDFATRSRAVGSTNPQPRIGVDLGGTKIEAIALGPRGEELYRHRTPTPARYDATITAIANLVAAASLRIGTEASVGVGAPGSLSPESGLWRNSNLDFCNGHDLPADLAAATGRPVKIENDGNCFALSEAMDGAGANAWTVYGVTAGTGLGGGMTVGQVLNRGANAAAGEIGHIPLPWLQPEDYPLPTCYCGLEGCAEQYLSGTGLARDFRAVTGGAYTGEEIMALAAAGKREAVAAIERLYERFARFLSVIVNVIDPDVIVLGGGLSKIPGFCENVASRVPRYTFAQDIAVRFVLAYHGDSSGVRGAARLWDMPAGPSTLPAD